MRVLMLIQDFYPATGGAERQCLKLSQELTNQGVTVKVLTRAMESETLQQDYIGDVKVERLKRIKPFEFAVIYWLIQILRQRNNFDVFHLHMVNEHTLGAVVVGLLVNKPVIVKFANSGSYFDVRRILKQGRKPVNMIIAKSLKYVDRFISITSAITKDIPEYGYDTKKIEIIPNGVETIPRLSPNEKLRMRRKFGIPDDMIVFLRIGSFLPKKGVSTLCTAWASVRAKNKSCFLLSVGGTTVPDEIKMFSERYQDSSAFVLNQPDGVKNYLQVADVFVLPSLSEGLSNALLEALSAGLPAIVTNVGGNTELVRSEVNGLIVDSGDHEALAKAMLELAVNPQKREYMSGQANAQLADFSIASVAKRYRSLYSQLIEEKTQPS